MDVFLDGDWRINIYTQAEAESGTDAQVTLTVIGDNGSSGPLVLGDAGGAFFSDGQIDQFDVSDCHVAEYV